MINKNLIELTKKLENNSKYLENMKNIKTSQELYDFCSGIVGGYSKEEFDNFAQNLINIDHELKALSDDKLASVSGGTIGEWLKNKMPTMPTNSQEFRLKVKNSKPLQAISSDGPGNVQTTAYYTGTWRKGLEDTTAKVSLLSMFIKLGEMIYYDDMDKMSPEEITMFALDLAGQS